jgi:hypothetical protein
MDLNWNDDAPSYAPYSGQAVKMRIWTLLDEICLELQRFLLAGRKSLDALGCGVWCAKRIRTPDPRITNSGVGLGDTTKIKGLRLTEGALCLPNAVNRPRGLRGSLMGINRLLRRPRDADIGFVVFVCFDRARFLNVMSGDRLENACRCAAKAGIASNFTNLIVWSRLVREDCHRPLPFGAIGLQRFLINRGNHISNVHFGLDKLFLFKLSDI